MKKILIILFLSFLCFDGYSQITRNRTSSKAKTSQSAKHSSKKKKAKKSKKKSKKQTYLYVNGLEGLDDHNFSAQGGFYHVTITSNSEGLYYAFCEDIDVDGELYFQDIEEPDWCRIVADQESWNFTIEVDPNYSVEKRRTLVYVNTIDDDFAIIAIYQDGR